MNIRRLLCVVLLGLGFTAPASAQDRCTAEPVTILPIVLLGGKVLVPVLVNDQPVLFAVDTGSNVSAISETLMSRMKLPTFPIRANTRVTGIGGVDATAYARIDSLVLGNLKASGERYMVGPLGNDGLLGSDYLRNFDLDFDFAANQLSLYRPRACADAPPGTGNFSKIKMDVLRTGHVRIPVTLDGKQLWAMLDTGAPGTMITASAASANFGIKAAEDKRVTIGGATGGTTEIAPHTFSSIAIGSFSQESPILAVAADSDVRFDQSQLLLGMTQMRGLRLYLSYRERNLYVSRPATR
jgi:predicted aspartyl protease